MAELLAQFPSMKRALFSAYHIGGCSSCAYGDTETLGGVCERNSLDFDEVKEEILESAEREAKLLISPEELDQLLKSEEEVVLIDCRTREEHEAVKIAGSELLNQELQNELFSSENNERAIILYDHTGTSVLDTCSWFIGHGLKNTKVLKGGIDRWSQEIDSSIPRYKIELS